MQIFTKDALTLREMYVSYMVFKIQILNNTDN